MAGIPLKKRLAQTLAGARRRSFVVGVLAAAALFAIYEWSEASSQAAGAMQLLAKATRPASVAGAQDACRVQLSTSCPVTREDAFEEFTSIYKEKKWGKEDYSHTLSGGGSTVIGAFECIIKLEPKFRELGIKSVADVPSGDCGWQFAISTINTADAYFGGDIAAHVAEENAQRFRSHYNKAFAFWDLVTCPLPHWHTTCDPTPRPFDIVIIRDAIQHMTVPHGMKALKSVVEQSGAKYIGMTSFSSKNCAGRNACSSIAKDGDFYWNAMSCPPFNFPEPFFSFLSHERFPGEPDYMELYSVEELKPVVATWDIENVCK